MTGGAGFSSNARTSLKNNRKLFKKDSSYGKKKFSVSSPKVAAKKTYDKAYLKSLRLKLKRDQKKTDIKRILLLLLAVLVFLVSFLVIKSL